jgi:hypothetical protein
MNQENAFPLGDTPDDDARSIVIELEAHDMEFHRQSRISQRLQVGMLNDAQLPIPISRAARPRSAETFEASLNGRCPKLSDTAHSFIFASPFSNFGEGSQFLT